MKNAIVYGAVGRLMDYSFKKQRPWEFFSHNNKYIYADSPSLSFVVSFGDTAGIFSVSSEGENHVWISFLEHEGKYRPFSAEDLFQKCLEVIENETLHHEEQSRW